MVEQRQILENGAVNEVLAHLLAMFNRDGFPKALSCKVSFAVVSPVIPVVPRDHFAECVCNHLVHIDSNSFHQLSLSRTNSVPQRRQCCLSHQGATSGTPY